MATGAEHVIAKAFRGNEVKMIVFASIVGGLASFCSWELSASLLYYWLQAHHYPL